MRGRRAVLVVGGAGSIGAALAEAVAAASDIRDRSVEIVLKPVPQMPDMGYCDVREPRQTKIRDWEQRGRKRRR